MNNKHLYHVYLFALPLHIIHSELLNQSFLLYEVINCKDKIIGEQVEKKLLLLLLSFLFFLCVSLHSTNEKRQVLSLFSLDHS